jgi:DNA-binding transcriptional ArsR family regulator
MKWLYNQQVMMVSQRLDVTFAALADPTRRVILTRLASGEASVTQLMKPFAMSQPAISRHLKVLERAGLIFAGSRRAATPATARSQAARRRQRMAGTLPPVLGGILPTPGRPA